MLVDVLSKARRAACSHSNAGASVVKLPTLNNVQLIVPSSKPGLAIMLLGSRMHWPGGTGVSVAVAGGVAVAVAVGVIVFVGSGVLVIVGGGGVLVGVFEGPRVGVWVGVLVGPGVGVKVGVFDGDGVGVRVGVFDGSGVGVAVFVAAGGGLTPAGAMRTLSIQ